MMLKPQRLGWVGYKECYKAVAEKSLYYPKKPESDERRKVDVVKLG